MPSDFTAKPPYNVFQPGAYSAVNASLLTSPNAGVGQPIPIVLGSALGGSPDTPTYFTNPSTMFTTLKGGPGYDVARFMFDGGAPQVGFVRVGNAITQATLALAGATGTVVTLTAQDWGSWCNSIEVTVAAGPIITLEYTDALGVVYTEQWNLTGVSGLTAAVIAQAINGELYGYSASNYVTAVAGAGTLPMATVSNAPLTGGTDGLTPAAGDWTTGLSAIETEPVDFVAVATSDDSVHAMVLTHCQNMSQPGARHERVTVVGGALGEDVAQQVTRIAALRSARAELVYPGMWDYNQSGNLTEYDPFYLAGKIIGMWCAQPDAATSILHQTVPIVDAETALSTVQGGAIDQLLQAGVTPIAKQPGTGGFWVVDALTGYNGSDGTFHDMIKTRSADYVAQYSRVTLEAQFVGTKKLATSQSSITQAALKILDDLVTQQIIYGYQAPSAEPGPTINGWNVSLPVMLIDTNKFIFITVQLQPSSTISGSTTTADVS